MMGVFSRFPLLLLLLLSFCFASFAFGATLAEDEVQALMDIANTIGKENWDFSVDPCSGMSNWTSSIQLKGSANAVTCDCSFLNYTVCHVVSIILKEQNLSGTISSEFIRLPYLKEIDFTRNYLNGPIPKQLGTLNLVNISFLGNRLTGLIPKELGNITTLKTLVLEFNQLSGNLPPELGNLTNIEILHLTSNYFTGELPATLARLTTLKHVRIGDNQFSGAIPNFIRNWINLEKLVMQGSGLSGPIPPGISIMINLVELRVTDLNGSDSPFPQLNDMTLLETLVLRSCNIIGSLPESLGKLTNLKVLDLSYNKLTGPIPSSFDGLMEHLSILFLDGNLLTGPLPQSIYKPHYVDLSYNNFSIDDTEQLTCQKETANLFASFSNGNSLGNVSCLSNIPCPKNFIPPLERGSSSISIKVMVAIVVIGAIIIILVFGILWWNGFLGWKRSVAKELKGLRLQTNLFTLRQIKVATNNFDKAFKIGEGGFGPVYKRICVGIAKGLAYLHEESRLKIVHRDIKTTNVLMDKDLNPKISDFGLAKLDDGDKTHLSTRIADTYGYMAPEYAMHGYLTDKADVYNFGIVTLEIVSGISNTISDPTEECFSLLDRVHLFKDNGNLMEIVDQRLGEDFNKKEAMIMINVALLCTKVSLALRPTMSSVVSMLEGTTCIQEVASNTRKVLDDENYETMLQYYQNRGESNIYMSQNLSVSTQEIAMLISDTGSSSGEIKS